LDIIEELFFLVRGSKILFINSNSNIVKIFGWI